MLAKIKTNGEKGRLKWFLSPAEVDGAGLWEGIRQTWLQFKIRKNSKEKQQRGQVPNPSKRAESVQPALDAASFLQLTDVMMSRQSVKHVSL